MTGSGCVHLDLRRLGRIGELDVRHLDLRWLDLGDWRGRDLGEMAWGLDGLGLTFLIGLEGAAVSLCACRWSAWPPRR